MRSLDGPVRHTPAIAVTAHARADDRARAREAGFDEYVPTPIESARLIRVVGQLAQHARAIDGSGSG